VHPIGPPGKRSECMIDGRRRAEGEKVHLRGIMWRAGPPKCRLDRNHGPMAVHIQVLRIIRESPGRAAFP
jgi:hypothetical protein